MLASVIFLQEIISIRASCISLQPSQTMALNGMSKQRCVIIRGRRLNFVA